MSRIPTPATIEAAPAAAQPLLAAVRKQIGMAPNLFRVIANSPAALEGYLGLNGALAKGALAPATRERIALAVAEINGCNDCLSTPTVMAAAAGRHAGRRPIRADPSRRERNPSTPKPGVPGP